MSLELRDAFDNLELLDSAGQVPSPLPVREMLQHTVTAQTLAISTTLLAGELITRIGTDPSQEQSKAVSQMTTAVTHTSAAAHHFSQTARTATSPAPRAGTAQADH
ncbi:hypothetical protein [Streptomyces olindensis]|uniref:hypothetical protein n=1 Tax=Streptomyces olindensis TaxID=358823 RepID=UPI0036633E1C